MVGVVCPNLRKFPEIPMKKKTWQKAACFFSEVRHAENIFPPNGPTVYPLVVGTPRPAL